MSLCLVTINLYSAVFIQRFQVQFKLPSDRMTVSKSIVSFHLFSFFICSVKLESNTNYCWHISRFSHDFDPNKDNIIVPNLLRFLFESFGTNFKRTAVFDLLIWTWRVLYPRSKYFMRESFQLSAKLCRRFSPASSIAFCTV